MHMNIDDPKPGVEISFSSVRELLQCLIPIISREKINKIELESNNQQAQSRLAWQWWQTLFINLISNLVMNSFDCWLTAMTRTDTGLAIVASGTPAVGAMPALLLQTVRHLLDCQWRGRSRWLLPDGLATAVCLIRTASLRADPRYGPYPQPPVTSAWRGASKK
jgi:hypothetical protein